MKKLLVFALILMMIISSVYVGFAADEVNTNVHIHKIIQTAVNFNNDHFPSKTGLDGTEYSGQSIGNLEAFFGAGSVERNGVSFTYYKIDGVAALDAITNEDLTNMTYDEVIELLTANSVDPAGTILSGTPKSLPSGRYYVTEVRQDTLLPKAVDFVLELPIANAQSGYMTDLHVYPKNHEEVAPTIRKGVDSLVHASASKQIGETFRYYVEMSIPAGIGTSKTFYMYDELPAGITYVGNLTVEYDNGGAVDPDMYRATVEDQNVTVVFVNDNPGNATHFLGGRGLDFTKKLVISFDVMINGMAPMDQNITNTASSVYRNENNYAPIAESDEVNVTTGGKTFLKRASGEGGVVLEGAYFELLDGSTVMTWNDQLLAANNEAIEAGKFGLLQGTTYKPTSPTAKPVAGNPIILRSVADGTFEIKGLDYSVADGGEAQGHQYSLKEVQAPLGYLLRDEDVNVTIASGTYAGEVTEIENTVKPAWIPATGGIGSVIFVVIGLLIMAISLYFYRRRNKEQN